MTMAFPFEEWFHPVDLSQYPKHKPTDQTDVRLAALVYTTVEPGILADLKVLIFGVPQDIGIQRNGGRIGASEGPAAIRHFLYRLTPFFYESSLDHPDLHLADLGDLNVEGLTLEEIHWRQERVVRAALEQGWLPIVLGGGHDIAFPNGAALGQHYDAIGIVNLDAHLDVRPLIDGQRAHSGSPFRQLLDHPDVFIPPGCLVEFGIQWFANAHSHWEFLREEEMSIFWLQDIYRSGFVPALETAFRKARQGTDAVYVTFDLDGVRASDAPGVSAPSPVGFSAEDYCYAAYYLGAQEEVKLMDVAELNPRYDQDGRTAKLAALVVAHFLAGALRRLE